jgi:class 3 adenylate cyclase/tetratricopeptide (TPR) repeat protein
MRCSRCQHENRTEAKFCEECAAPLGRTCLNCGHIYSARAKYCSECGQPVGAQESKPPAPRFASPEKYTPKHLAAKILTAKSAIEGERKLVTVLFADIKGSTELIANQDPEDAQDLLDPVLERMIEAVHRYEGTVSRVMGDGILALFGAPLAHEDHAVRACYAALRMQQTLASYTDRIRQSHGVPVMVRVGLNSGEIVVRTIGSDLHVDYIVIGETVHLAARMEQMARPGTILATAKTLRLVEGYIAAKSLGPSPVKGLVDPIEVYEIIGGGPARTRLQAAAGRGLTRFVGRDSELNQLRKAHRQACGSEGQVVAVAGAPGVGKSRLVHEFLHNHAAGCLVLETASASYARATPYLPVIELLRRYFKIDSRDSKQSIQEKVTGRAIALDPLLQNAVPAVLDLLDALPDEHPFRSLDPPQHRQQTCAAVTRLLQSESRVQPVVAVFEDLHWNDSLTIGLLSELIVGMPDNRLLLIVTYRLEHRDEWKSRPNYRQLQLEPLANEDLAELLQTLLGTDSSLQKLKDFLLERADGNPFFVEEMVRSLLDSEILQGARGQYLLVKPFSIIKVPTTVQAVLGARIDALPPAEKRLLQEASVIGHDAPFALLHAISGLAEDEARGLLGKLQAAGFLFTTQLFPDLQFTFKHALTHEVAYGGLLHERRREVHARIVDAVESLFVDRLGEHVESLATHALHGNLWEKAVVYLRQAGAKAADRLAYEEAVALFEQALHALSRLPEDRIRLEQKLDVHFDIRNVLQPLGDRQRIASYLRQAELLAGRLNDARRTGWVQSYLTDHFWMLGRYGDAAAAGEQAIAIAEQLCDLPLQVVTNLPLGLAHHTRGDYRRALEYFRWNATRLEGELVRERFGMFVLPSSFSRSFAAWGLADMGEFAEGSAVGEEALRIAKAAEHPFSCGYAHLGLGVVSLRQGDLRRALRSFERALAAGAFADSPVGFAYVALHLGYARALTGQPDDGISILEQSVKIAEGKGFVARHALRLAYLSEAHLIADRGADAAAIGLRALELAVKHDERANQAYALRVLGEVDAHCGKAREAEARFRAALLISEELGLRPLEAHCHLSMAHLAAERQPLAAAAHRKSAAALADAMHLRFWGAGL